MNKAIFLDKDGTLIPDIPYNVKPELIRLSDNAAAGLRTLRHAGYLLVVVSNQSGVAKGFFGEEALELVLKRLTELFEHEGITLDGFYYCPHFSGSALPAYNIDCDCRKPKPGMLINAAKDMNIDLKRSWMIGDILNDVEAGHLAGCKSILIDNGNETEWLLTDARLPDYKLQSIDEAAEMILKQEGIWPHEHQLERL